MSNDFDVNQLARHAKTGDTVAFEAIARSLTPSLMRFFSRKGDCDPEELTQQTWLQVANGFAQYDTGRDFKAWLFSIAYYRWVDSRRGRKIERILVDIPESSLDDPVTRDEFVVAMQDCMLNLSEVDRSIIYLRYWEELELRAVAKEVDLPYASVKGKAHRARESLAKCLGKKFS
ncbi:MAG: RNA polymerase sigma factor [Planctomycetota bacterium]